MTDANPVQMSKYSQDVSNIKYFLRLKVVTNRI